MPTKKSAFISNYWLCQIFGWSSMVFIEIVNYSFFIIGKFNIKVLYVQTACALFGILITHLYKKIVKRQHLFEYSRRYIWLFAFISTFIISTIISIVTEVPLLIMSKDGWKNLTFINVAGTIINWARYVGVWIIIYFLYEILKQNNKIEQEKLSFESLAKTTELELLKTQLNPHFLFNALNSIKALVVINPEQSRDAIVKLSELLRFTLQYGKERFITLQQEIQEVQKYLDLELVRFGDRLEVAVVFPESCYSVQIPPAIILTLTENAVKHGVAKNIGPGFIHITVSPIDSAFVQIKIENSGQYQPTNLIGIGLKHVQKRMDEMYGGKASFTISGNQNIVTATLQIPVA